VLSVSDPAAADEPSGQEGPLIGREQELAALNELLAAGRGGLAVISGPVGMGKSKLLREVARRARAIGWDVLQLEVRLDTPIDRVASWAATADRRLLLVADGWRPAPQMRDWLERRRARRDDRPPLIVLIGEEESSVAELRHSTALWLDLEPPATDAIRSHLQAAGRGLVPPLSASELVMYVNGVRERPELLHPLARVLQTSAATVAELGAAP
jgi:hypothetical protein